MSATLSLCLISLISSMVSLEELRFEWIAEQEYDYSCGVSAAASLANIFWGIDTDERKLLEVLEAAAGDDGDISLLDLGGLLQSLGFTVRGYRLGYDVLLSAAERYGPLIVHMEEGRDRSGHFVLFLGESALEPVIGDPSDGVGVWSMASFSKGWSGTVLVAAHSVFALDSSAVASVLDGSRLRHSTLRSWGSK